MLLSSLRLIVNWHWELLVEIRGEVFADKKPELAKHELICFFFCCFCFALKPESAPTDGLFC